MLVRYLSRALEKAGFTVFSASSAAEGMQLAEEHGPDLILLDILLPGNGGEDLLAQLQRGEKTKDIPVAVVTNLTDSATRDKCFALGCADFIVKADYRLDQLVEKIASLLEAHAK